MKPALLYLLLALALAVSPSAMADNSAFCADLANKIRQLDESIAANSNNSSQQRYLIDSRNTYSRTYNELCTGGGGGGAPSYSTGPNRDQAIINGVFGLLRFLEQRDREQRWRDEQRRQQQLQAQRYREEQRRLQEEQRRLQLEREWDAQRREQERLRREMEERDRKEREADNLMRNKTPNPFDQQSKQPSNKDDNPFPASPHPYGDGCPSILRKLKAGGFGACPNIDAGARFCSLETADAKLRGWCELSVTSCTFDTQACKSQRLREDLTYERERKKAEYDLDEAIKDYKCKTGQEKSCQPDGH